MKALLAVTALGSLAIAAATTDEPFFLGTYTNGGPSEGIYAGSLNTETGTLSPLQLAGKAVDPTFLAVSPDGRFLFACLEGGDGSVASFRIESPTSLIPINERPAGGKGTCHVWVDAGGHHLLAANYSEGNIASFPIGSDGSLGAPSSIVAFTGSGPHPKRQQKPYAHSIYTDPENQHVYACDLGSDNVWTFAFDPAKGTLTPTDPPSAKVPPGGGPRHLAFHPDGRFAYVNNEMGLSVTVFSRDSKSGQLTPIQTVPTLPTEASADGSTTSEIQCHPNGKWLYVTNRGHDSIAVFAIESNGMLRCIENVPCGVKFPRGCSLDPSGRWMVVGGQKDHRITVLKVDQSTGRLSPTGHFANVGSPVCVQFLHSK